MSASDSDDSGFSSGFSDSPEKGHQGKHAQCMSIIILRQLDICLVNAMDQYLDKNQDGVSVRRETPWISTIRGPASRLESLKTVPNNSSGGRGTRKPAKKRHESSEDEEDSFESESDSSEESESSDDNYRSRGRKGRAAPQMRASSRLKEIGSKASYRDESSPSDYSSDASSPPRKWQPPKRRAPIPTMSSSARRKPQTSESEDASSMSESDNSDSDSSMGSATVQDNETDVEEIEDLIVEKIIAKRKTDAGTWEFLIKYKGRSYMHCEWLSHKDMSTDIGSDKRSVKLKNFNSKHHSGPTVPSFENKFFYNPQFETIEKIIAVRGNEYLVKWVGLPYGESTWEHVSGLSQPQFESAKKEFESLNAASRCAPRFKTNSKESYGRVLGRQHDPTADFSRQLRAIENPTDSKLPLEYEYVPEGRSLGDPPFRIFDFQKEGISWLLYNWSQARGCILADEMGLGKTVQTAVTLSQMTTFARARGAGELCHLIIAPLSTIEQWRREMKKWTELEPVVFHGNRRDRNVIHKYEWDGRIDIETSVENGEVEFEYRKSPSYMPKFDVMITTFETVSLEPEVFNAPDFVWSSIVIDEAHRLKSAEGRARTAVLGIPCRHRILLTGTPIQNNVAELWTLLHLCAPAVWEDREAFIAEFGELKSAELTQKLQNKIQPFLLQRRKADVLAHLMPAKEETIVSVELTRLQKETYRAVYEKNIALLAGTGAGKKTVPALTNVHMELRKCCNHPFLVTGVEDRVTKELTDYGKVMEYLINSSGKMVFVDKLLGKLRAERSKILIFSQFTMMLDLIEDYLRWRGYAFERLDGAVKSQQRQEAVDRFNRTPEEYEADEGSFVFLLSTKAGGVGLNLTAANYVLLFDHDWNPQNDLQAQARCHRIGQKKQVMIFRLVTRGTYEEKMFQVASQKLGLEQAVMSGEHGKAGAPKLTKEEMDRLLKEGAYAMLEDDENEKRFCAENVDEILKTRAKTVSTFVKGEPTSGAGGGFSKARFQVNEGDADLDINDPNFWSKMANVGQLSLKGNAKDEHVENLDYSQRKGRAQFGQTKREAGSSMDDFSGDSDYSNSEGAKAVAPRTSQPAVKDKIAELRLKRMKLVFRYVLAFGLTENKELFDSRFSAWDDPSFAELPDLAYADHLLLTASLYVMARQTVSSKFDEIHFCPSVRAAVGLLAQFRTLNESPPASLEPLSLDSMFPDLSNSIDRLDVMIPAAIVPQPLPKYITEAVPKNRNAKKIVLEIDAFNEIRFNVKVGGKLLRNVGQDRGAPDNWSREKDVELLKEVVESGREVVGEKSAWKLARIEKILPKISLVRAFQLTLTIGSLGFHPPLLEKALKATGFPWTRKFACGESCMDLLAENEMVDTLLTPVTEVPPPMEFQDEGAFTRFVLTQLPPDSPLSVFDVADYAKALLYRTILALGKKSDKHDMQVRSVLKSTKSNEYMFDMTGGLTVLSPQREITRLEAFKLMWRFQTLHFLRTAGGEFLFSQLDSASAFPTLVAVARGLGLDRWELITSVNRHMKPVACLQTVMKFICDFRMKSEAAAKAEHVKVEPVKRKSPHTSSGEDGEASSKMVKLTDFFNRGGSNNRVAGSINNPTPQKHRLSEPSDRSIEIQDLDSSP